MCVICNHQELPAEGFRASYLQGLLFGIVSAEAGGKKALRPVIEGFCSSHRRLWNILEEAFERTGTARVLADRRSKADRHAEACIEAVKIIAADTEGDQDPWYLARKITEDNQ